MDLDLPAARRQANYFSRFAPRARLLGGLLLSLEAVLAQDWPAAALLLLLGLAFCPASGGGRDLRRLLLPLNFFLAFIWATLPVDWLGPDSPAFSRPGFDLCVLITLKANAAAVFLFMLLNGLSPAQLADALREFRLPDKFCTLFILLCRHIQILQQSLHASLLAAKLRPRPPRQRDRLKIYAYVLGSTLVHAADRAEMVRLALLCKGDLLLRLPGPAQRLGRGDLLLVIACGLPLPLFSGMLQWL